VDRPFFALVAVVVAVLLNRHRTFTNQLPVGPTRIDQTDQFLTGSASGKSLLKQLRSETGYRPLERRQGVALGGERRAAQQQRDEKEGAARHPAS